MPDTLSGAEPKETASHLSQTYLYKTPYARPKTVVWQLSPTSSVHNSPLVEQATAKIHRQSHQGNDQEQTTWPDTAWFVRLRLGAGVLGHDAEDIGALVLVHLDERQSWRRGPRVVVASEGYDGGFSPYGGILVLLVFRLHLLFCL